MVAVLLARGQQAAVLRLEELWNLLHSHRDFSLLCAYPIAGFVGTGRAEGLDDICTQHAHVIPAESYSALTTPDERLSAIASLQQKAASLEAEVAEREAAVHHRDEFLSAISHDLKTPLTVLQGQAQLLRRRAARGSLDGPGLERGLEQIESRARLMAELIDELLDVTRLRSGQQLQLDRHLVELVGLVGEVIAVHQQTAPRHRLTLLTTEKSLPGRWDRRQLRRVLDNLLTNAVKYTPDGGEITLELARETAPTGDVVILTVTDPGIGIPGEDLPHIFERFYRGRNTASVNVGTGLGLAGARQIVEQHGGTIAAGSIPGQGATFTVRLPMQHSAG
jgi:signal transduction histidine kinase